MFLTGSVCFLRNLSQTDKVFTHRRKVLTVLISTEQYTVYYKTRLQAGFGSASVCLLFRCKFYLMVNCHLNTLIY